MINVGGEKSPHQSRKRPTRNTRNRDCLVYAESNAITGQIVAAEIVLKSDCDPKSIKRAIKNHCRSQLSSYKVPVKIYFKEATNFSTRYKKMRLREP